MQLRATLATPAAAAADDDGDDDDDDEDGDDDGQRKAQSLFVSTHWWKYCFFPHPPASQPPNFLQQHLHGGNTIQNTDRNTDGNTEEILNTE